MKLIADRSTVNPHMFSKHQNMHSILQTKWIQTERVLGADAVCFLMRKHILMECISGVMDINLLHCGSTTQECDE